MIAFRICENKNGKLLTLFHGINGSRVMPTQKWITSQTKTVRDGSRSKAKEYISGFHVLPTLDECRQFSKKFRAKRELVIVECEIDDNFWEKEHSPANVLLAKNIKINKIVEKIII